MEDMQEVREVRHDGRPIGDPLLLPDPRQPMRAALAELVLAGALVCAAIDHKSVNWSEKPDASRLLKALEQGREALSR